MKRYSIEDLSNPAIYQNDPTLATLARKVAEEHFDSLAKGRQGLGQFKRDVLDGRYPTLVADAVNRTIDHVERAGRAAEEARDAAPSLLARVAFPCGWTSVVGTHDIELRGPYVEELRTRLARLGRWDAEARVWHIPFPKAKSLRQLFAHASQAATAAAHTTALDDLQRWVSYVEDHANNGRLYDHGLATLNTLGLAAHPDLVARVEAARALVPRRAAEIATADLLRWLSYVEEHANRGQVYHKGILQCQARGIATRPDLLARLNAATSTAHREAARTRAARVDAARPNTLLFPLAEVPHLHVPIRLYGTVLVLTAHGKTRRIHESDPSASGSHLLGHEEHLGVECYYRDATPEEVTQLEQHEERTREAQRARAARSARIDDIRRHIRDRGICPTSVTLPQGDMITLDLYGRTRDAFIITADAIWYVEYNGADGDDWALNNCAGAIARYVPFDIALATTLKTLTHDPDPNP